MLRPHGIAGGAQYPAAGQRRFCRYRRQRLTMSAFIGCGLCVAATVFSPLTVGLRALVVDSVVDSVVVKDPFQRSAPSAHSCIARRLVLGSRVPAAPHLAMLASRWCRHDGRGTTAP